MEKKKITSGYNFVPLENVVYFPEWAEQVSQDIPFMDGEDGIIDVSVENVTPLFVGGPQNESEKAYSCHVIRDGKKHYFIPGSTIKGCIRNVLEVLSFAKVGDHAASHIGYRDVGNQNSDYSKIMREDVHCGWLFRGAEDSFYLSKCKGRLQKIMYDDLKKKFPTFYKGQDQETAQAIQESLTNGKELYPSLIVDAEELRSSKKHFVPEGEYKVVCTGFMSGKEVAYLFPVILERPIKVEESVSEEFLSVHENTKYFGSMKDLNTPGEAFLLKRLMNSNSPDNGIPVFYKTNKDQKVINIGITRMYRIAYPLTVDGAINNVSSKHLDQEKCDLPETIFGYAKGSSSLKGRVQFTSAFQNSGVIISDEECNKLRFRGVLGQPKSSFWPLYLDQSNGRASFENTNSKIAGRKRYRIIDGKVLVAPCEGNGNENILDTFYPIPAGNKFSFKIAVHNLKKVEIGALLSSITFNGNGGCFHNLGKAKAFGYGKVSLKVENMEHFQFSMEEYIEAFNSEMSGFYQVENRGKKMADSESLKALVSIASATHTAEEMKQLELAEFSDYKKNDVQTIILESIREYQVGIDESGKLQSSLQSRFASIVNRMNVSGDYETSKYRLAELERLYIDYNLNTDAIKESMASCERKLEEVKARAEKEREENAAKESKEIDKRAAEMSLADRLANISQVKNIPIAVASWMRQASKKLGDAEIDTIVNKLNSFTPKPDIGSKKNRAEYEKRIGKEATDILLTKYQS